MLKAIHAQESKKAARFSSAIDSLLSFCTLPSFSWSIFQPTVFFFKLFQVLSFDDIHNAVFIFQR